MGLPTIGYGWFDVFMLLIPVPNAIMFCHGRDVGQPVDGVHHAEVCQVVGLAESSAEVHGLTYRKGHSCRHEPDRDLAPAPSARRGSAHRDGPLTAHCFTRCGFGVTRFGRQAFELGFSAVGAEGLEPPTPAV